MQYWNYASYTLAVAGFVLIPGPATIFTITKSITYGRKIGVSTACGIAAGDLFHTTMTIIGLTALISTSVTLFSIIKYAGAAYLVFIGIRTLLSDSTLVVSKTNSESEHSTAKAFSQAMTVEILNPKTALFFLSFLPQFVVTENGSVGMQLAMFGIIFIAASLISTLSFGMAANSIGSIIRKNRGIGRFSSMCAGSIYCILGAKVMMQSK